MLQHIIGNPLAFCSPLSPLPFCSPFVPLYLLGTLLAVIGSVHLVPRLHVNWSSHFPPLALIPLIPKSRPPWGFPDLNIPSLGLHRETGSQDPAHIPRTNGCIYWKIGRPPPTGDRGQGNICHSLGGKICKWEEKKNETMIEKWRKRKD